MKPRLASLPMTPEDIAVADHVLCRLLRGGTMGYYSIVFAQWLWGDARDAALMLGLERTRSDVPHPDGRAVAHSVLSWRGGRGDYSRGFQ